MKTNIKDKKTSEKNDGTEPTLHISLWDSTKYLNTEKAITNFLKDILDVEDDPLLIDNAFNLADRARKRWGIKPSKASFIIKKKAEKNPGLNSRDKTE